MSRAAEHTSNKQGRKILSQLEAAGWRIERRKSHVLAWPPDGTSRPITIGGISDGKGGGATLRNMLSNIVKIDPSLKGKIRT